MTKHTEKSTIGANEQVRRLLEQGHPDRALDVIDHNDQNSTWMKNARAVCLLRLGKAQDAIRVLADITFQGNICIPSDTPAVYQTNFATALLIANNKEGAIDIIDRLHENHEPLVEKLANAVDKWRKGLTLVQKVLCKIGIFPGGRIQIDFCPGDLD